MKTYLMSLLAAAMMLTGAAAFAADEESGSTTHSSSTTKLEVEELKPVAEETAEEPAPAAMKPAKQYKRSTSNKPRPKDLDFRHCLELTDNAAIAQCAREQ
jgi:hypothetical protein